MIQASRQLCQRAALAVLLLGAAASPASAQWLPSIQGLLGRPWDDRGFFNVNFASQAADRRSIATDAFPLYQETAIFESTVNVSSAAVADVMGAWRLWRNLAVGLAYSGYSDSTDAVFTASIPDPLFFDSPHPAGAVLGGQKHRENAVHLSALWMRPVTDKIDVAVFAGPSFILLSKDLVTGFDVVPGTSELASIHTTRISETGTGGHIGFDVRYTIREDLNIFGFSRIRKLGAGIFVRYSAASVDANVQGGSIDLGGLNYGIGLRVGF
jgi:hypothetical protein